MRNNLVLLSSIFLFAWGVVAERTEFRITSARSMGEEAFGNKSLPTGNYEPWPGLSDVVNDERRVYQQWVNGSEFCCYVADMEAINELIKQYSDVTCEKHQLVLRPGPGIESTFEADKTVEYDCKVSFSSGIAAHMATRDKGNLICTTWPVFTIEVTDRIDLEQLAIPDNIEVLQLEDVKASYLQALKSSDQSVRGFGCWKLATLNKFDVEIMEQIVNMLEDKDDWVRINALAGLAMFGKKVEEGMLKDRVEAFLDSENPQLKERAKKALKEINESSDDPDAENAFEDFDKVIRNYCAGLKKDR